MIAAADPEERRRRAADLAGRSGANAVEQLIGALGDEDWRVRKEATRVAREVGPGQAVLAALVEALKPGENVGLRNAAVEALATFGRDAVAALAGVADELDADGRKLVADALSATRRVEALGVLERLLRDEDPNVRAAAMEAVAAVGQHDVPAAAPLLEARLDEADEFLRLCAVEGLVNLGAVVDASKVLPLLTDPMLRAPALPLAARTGCPDAAAPIVEALSSDRLALREEGLAALAELAAASEAALASRTALAAAPRAVREWVLSVAASEGDRLELRRTALTVCGLLGDEQAAQVALAALADDRVVPEAEGALEMLGPLAVTALLEALAGGSSHDRAAKLDLLGRLAGSPPDPRAAAALHEALRDPARDVQRAALAALAAAGDAESIDVIAERLATDLPAAVRQSAIRALAECGRRFPARAAERARKASPERPEALAACVLIGALSDPVLGVDADAGFLADAASNESAAVRSAALEAVVDKGGEPGLRAAIFALTDEDPEVRIAAIRALGSARDADGNAPGADALIDLVQREPSDVLAGHAIRALGGTDDPRAPGVLRPLVRSPSPVTAVRAVEALGALEYAGRTDALIDALNHSDAEVAKAALRELARHPDALVVAHLGACLDHEAWDVRRMAADQLGRLGSEAALELLRARLVTESEPLVIDAIERSLGARDGGDSSRPPRRRSSPP